MSLLTREQFLTPYVPPTEEVPCPEFGEGAAIAVRGMTVRERSAFEKQFLSKKGDRVDGRVQEFRERLLVACCRDANGAMLFTLPDVRQIGEQNPAVVERIVGAARRLSGMTEDDEPKEDAVKNSDTTQGG